jgi:hypothetical protein
MTKTAIIKALNKELSAEDAKAEICLYGGTAMILAFNARLSTKDAVFRPKPVVASAAEKVAGELGLTTDWLNDASKVSYRKMASLPPKTYRSSRTSRSRRRPPPISLR